MFMSGGSALSHSPVVGVHNISERTLVQDRQIPIPPKPRVHDIALQALVAELPCRRTKRQKTNPGSTALQAVMTGPLQALGAVSSGRHSTHQKEKTANIALQAQVSFPSRPTAKRTGRTTNNIAVPSAAVPGPVAHEDSLYVRQLRFLLVERLQVEEEYERLNMYLRDNRFEPNVMKTK
jgi:hypothetical protein